MRKLITIVTTAVVVMVLAGCSPISAGTVTGKEYEPRNTYTTTLCQPVGKMTVCSPQYHVDDEDWRLDIREGGEDGFVYVTEAEFGSYQVGDYYGAPGE